MEVTLAIPNQEYSIENNINTRLCSETNSPPKLNILLLAIFEYRSHAVQRYVGNARYFTILVSLGQAFCNNI